MHQQAYLVLLVCLCLFVLFLLFEDLLRFILYYKNTLTTFDISPLHFGQFFKRSAHEEQQTKWLQG